MEEHNLLDDIFNTSEEQVETFIDVMDDAIKERGDEFKVDKSDAKRIKSGKPDGVSVPNLLEQISGFISITHGWDKDDYVWHMVPVRATRTWKVSLPRVLYAIIKTMNETIPQNVKVDIFPPYSDWDIKEITFKAYGLNYVWQIGKKEISSLNLKLFEVLNTLL